MRNLKKIPDMADATAVFFLHAAAMLVRSPD